MTKLPLYIGLMSKHVTLQYQIGMYQLDESDIRDMIDIEQKDIREVGKLLAKACEIASQYEKTNASDPLRIAIYDAIKIVLSKLTQPEFSKFGKIMEPIEMNLIKFINLFTDKQKRWIQEQYKKLCAQFSRPVSAELDGKLAEPHSSPVKGKDKPAKFKPVIYIPELKEWRKNTLGMLISKQMVDVNDIVSFVRRLTHKYPGFKIADVIIMLITKEKPSPLNTKLWKLMSKANKIGELFDRIKSKAVNEVLDDLIARSNEYREEKKQYNNVPRAFENLEVTEMLNNLRPSHDISDMYSQALCEFQEYIAEIQPAQDLHVFGSYATNLYT